jgi:predicted transposase YbfD/YdcC
MAFNHYLDFPLTGQAFVIQRESIDKKTGEHTHEVVYGVTSCTSEKANAEKILKTNREHWGIENSCHYVIDWNYNEDLCRIRTGHGPTNITRLRRFAVGLIKSKGVNCVAQKYANGF